MAGGYPAGAFALAFILFSSDMKQAFISGILVILITVVAALFKDLLMGRIPRWSLCACVCLGAAGVSAAVFQTALYVSGIENPLRMYLLEFLLGVLCAEDVLKASESTDYNRLLLETSTAWAVLIAAGVFREFMSFGSIYGADFGDFHFQSKGFGKLPVGILTAGVGLGCINTLNHVPCRVSEPLAVILPVVILYPPSSLLRAAGLALILVFSMSVREKIKFSYIPSGFRNIPVQLISVGLICMLLSDLAFTIR